MTDQQQPDPQSTPNGRSQAADSSVLVRRIGEGDADALGQLLGRLLPGLRAFVRLNMGPLLRAREHESDLVQSSFRRILEDLPKLEFKSERELRVYVYRSALHHLLNRRQYHTAERRDPRTEAGALTDSVPPEAVIDAWRSISSPSAQAIRAEQIEQLERAFDQLTPEQREIVSLRRMFALPLAEIAERLGIEESRVRYQLGKAMTKLSFLVGGDQHPQM